MRKAFFDPHPGHSPERFQAIGRGLGVASVPWWGGAPLDEGLSPNEPFDDGNRLGHGHRGPTTHVDGDAGLAPGRRGQQRRHDIADEGEVPPLAAVSKHRHPLPLGNGVDEAMERHVRPLAWTVDGEEPQRHYGEPQSLPVDATEQLRSQLRDAIWRDGEERAVLSHREWGVAIDGG